ncbi:hypothetical protein [Mycoplasmopsis cricetuli]|uniref:hypothetical protein n=1 Tax=Mycoplasmopsis cricetuli TaxID=171283 RepID=UPI00046F75AD|nr:hypothetical protein [Mycoplasmopsis cricetuli]
MSNLSIKLEDILSATIELYIETNQPVSSDKLIKSKGITYSSAKIRYLMNDLEKQQYLKKSHSSAGRIPTPKGLSYYAKYIAKANENQKILEKKIKTTFYEKKQLANITISQAAETISDVTGLTLITTKFDKNLILKSIDLVPINNFTATTVMVLSNGEVHSKIISIKEEEIKIKELQIAVRVFKDYLVGVPLEDLVEKTLELKEILKEQISNYLAVINQFIENIFNIKKKNNIYGRNELILSKQLTREQVKEIIDFAENFSIWEKIEEQLDKQDDLKILVNDSSAFITKRIKSSNGTTEISVVGPQNSDFKEMKAALFVFEKYIKKGE